MFWSHGFLKAQVLSRLGLGNVFTVGAYRLRLRLGIHPVQRVRRSLPTQGFFRAPINANRQLAAPDHWRTHALYFGWFRERLADKAPDWHLNPFNGQRVAQTQLDWWKLSDFATGVGDIKTVWEASRFDWVLAFAQQVVMGDEDAITRLNKWLVDWCLKNPAYRGPNWKCGQEASIRVLHLLLAARLLGQWDEPEPTLVALIEAHLARIASTIDYAMAQDNNHGTSEAAALFVGGAWCCAHGHYDAFPWEKTGRDWLENRVQHLIDEGGTFSQYSVNYHRLMLDTLSVSELFRRDLGLAEFSKTFYARAKAAAIWLLHMTDESTGDAPNLGANDGANLLPLSDVDYRDYRPSVALACHLFAPTQWGQTPKAADAQQDWLGVGSNLSPQARESLFHAPGFMVLRHGPWGVVFRYPEYRFRPSHCDQLHVDLWLDSQNWLRDAGSYSYNTDDQTAAYFTGAAGHNTIEFDQREAMPRLGRFLRGAWLRTHELQEPQRAANGAITAAAAYRDWQGALHHRQLSLSDDGLVVIDTVSGFKQQAVLRWRLPQGDWQLQGSKLRAGEIAIHIEADVTIERLALVEGCESRYYLNREVVKVLEVCVRQPGKITSSITRIQ